MSLTHIAHKDRPKLQTHKELGLSNSDAGYQAKQTLKWIHKSAEIAQTVCQNGNLV
jgi:hypothetical protein